MTKKQNVLTEVNADIPKAVIVLTFIGSENCREFEQEFIDLVESAGIEIVGTVHCKSRYVDSNYFVGKGKSRQIVDLTASTSASLIVVDCALRPRQTNNLKKITQARVLDRTTLILDIFAQRASSHEGKLQVELAQLKHLSTGLTRTWTHLERQKGGIGLRGPGEKQLETDRRLVRKRMNTLSIQIDKIKQSRDQRRYKRSKNNMLSISLVGYTNAGKSTLFNTLTGENVLSSKRLFATLDPTIRKLNINNSNVLISDTVGFIRNLPHQLIEAFNATLLEIREADLILHVEDNSTSECFERRREVENILKMIEADAVPKINVMNKIDRNEQAPKIEYNCEGQVTNVYVSALKKEGLDLLKQAILERLQAIEYPHLGDEREEAVYLLSR